MNYEQRYKEALKAVNELQDANPTDEGIQNWVNDNVPELQESEDESIRKIITLCLEECVHSGIICDYEKDKCLAWLEKQGHTDGIIEKAKTEKQRVIITETDGNANIDWDTRSLQDVKLLLEYGLDYINKLDEKNCLSNTKPSIGDLKIISSLKDIEEATWGTEKFSMKVRDILSWLEKQVPADEDEIVKGIRRGVAISLMNHIDANSKGMCLSNMECEDIENAIVNEDWDKVYGYMKKKLEKQGEQNLVNKVEPKFHKGD